MPQAFISWFCAPLFVPVQITGQQQHAAANHPDTCLPRQVHDQLLVVADGVPYPSKDYAPDRSAQAGVKSKPEMIHPAKSSRNGDQLPDDRQQSADKGGNFAMLPKKILGLYKFFLGKAYKFAILEQQGPSQIQGAIVIYVGAGQRAESPSQHHQPHIHPALKDQIPGRGHDQFTGKRDSGTFNHHQQKDAGVPQGAYGVHQPNGYTFKPTNYTLKHTFSLSWPTANLTS